MQIPLPGLGKPIPLSERIFKKYDKDGSGSIDVKEFKAMVMDMGYHLSDEEYSVAVLQLDSDGNGSIDLNEFKKFWAIDDRFEKLRKSDEELEFIVDAAAFFVEFDEDRSGVLELNEAEKMHKRLVEEGKTTKPFNKFKEDLDVDNSGTISFNEYINWLIREGTAKVKVLE
eukprot:GCRY01001618.1.p1 GENE.GCRY01001618.1~~GCRY01001618.1.p1  ORF type:complete len:171 (-),score=42.15 GCRY01001618.1:397-909(-)